MPITHKTPPAYNPAEYVPAPPPLPTLSVTAKGVVHLHPTLVEKLSLRDKQAINLVPPSYDSPYWHLDLRPEASRRIDWYSDQRPRVRGLRLPAGLVPTNQPLTLCLLPGEPYYPNVYPLLPHAQPAQANASPLAARPH